MRKQMNKHGPGCMLCAYEKSRVIRAGCCGYNNHKYCSNNIPCDGYKINPPEYKERIIVATYRGGLRGGQ
jgi:predicted  nucleic acid-binding Zn-ribbon protein